MMKNRIFRRCLSVLLVFILMISSMTVQLTFADVADSRYQLVLTLAADITSAEKADLLNYFGITEDQAKVITITNADEYAHLGDIISADLIGTQTYSSALIRLTTSGGIRVKTANMYFVNANMISSALTTSGVFNCEVLAAAPFSVSGTGALTGVMMAYEAGTGTALDPEKKKLANEEIVITGEIGETVGQEQATLVVNDIKIVIVRDGISQEQEVNQVVDDVIATTQAAAEEAAAAQGLPAPAKLGTVETQKLYNFGYKFSQMKYSYADLQPTLERVTRNITKSTGIADPITDTFTTPEDDALSIDSILLNTNDSVMGEGANINATDSVALGDHPAEEIEVYSGDVRLTKAGGIKADRFISGSSLIAFKDVNGLYALMDLNGNILTESAYTDEFRSKYGLITAKLADDNRHGGVLNTDGTILVPFQYDVVEVLGNLWAAGIYLVEGTSDDYDYYGYGGGKYQIGTVDLYYFGNDKSAPVSSLTREQYGEGYAVGDYLNVRDRNGTVVTYDPDFQIIQYPDSLYDSSYDEAHRAAEELSSRMNGSVSRFEGNYAKIYRDGKYGVVDRYGNIIIPTEFDSIYSTDGSIITGGYTLAKKDGNSVFVVQGGTVTAQYAVDPWSLYNNGMASYMKDENKVYTIYSGDGVVSTLDAKYSYLSPLDASKGLLWKAQLPDYSYDLIDWHGNVLLSDCKDYSISANGNYLIAQDGYTSSSLYLVNDASPVSIAETAGGASELEAQIREGASLEAYQGDPAVELLATTIASDFISGTSLMIAEDPSTEKWLIADVSGRTLTEAKYTNNFEHHYGWLIVEEEGAGRGRYGVLSMNGSQVLPCEYDVVKVLNENWIVSYKLVPGGTEGDHDFSIWGTKKEYYLIDQAVVSHVTQTDISSVTLTRDQIMDIQACEEYINVKNRIDGTVTTYDAAFTAVATVSYVSSFQGFDSMAVLQKTIQDKTGGSLYDANFPDGYSRLAYYTGGESTFGVVDMNGDFVIPAEFEGIKNAYLDQGSCLWANGYFCVEKDEKIGYVTEGGNITCEISYPEDDCTNGGMAASLKNADGSYSLIAADGVKTDGYQNLISLEGGRGLFWRCRNASGYGYDLIDWHGNQFLNNYNRLKISGDGKYILAQKSYGDNFELYGVDGAKLEGADNASNAGTDIVPADDTGNDAVDNTAADAAGNAAADNTAADAAGNAAADNTAADGAGNAAADNTAADAAGNAAADNTAVDAGNGAADSAVTDAAGNAAVDNSSEDESGNSAAEIPAEGGDTAAAPDDSAGEDDNGAGVPDDSVTDDMQDNGTGETPSGNAAVESAKAYISSVLNLAAIDLEANRDAIGTLLQEAQKSLGDQYPGAAGLLSSAASLISAGNADLTSVTTLINTALGMLG
ncbi:MAG: DUF1002 domain-containing protein [Blautia sp.]|nr:DUF1002 domain-containing protein [Blautia sp.]